MSLARTKVAQYVAHLRDTLRTNLATEITAANAELGGLGVDLSGTLSVAASQIDLGDRPIHSGRGAHYPQVMIDNVEMEVIGQRSAGSKPARVLATLHCYSLPYAATRATASSAMVSALVLTSAVEACVEKYAPSTAYGDVQVTAIRDRTDEVDTDGKPHLSHLRKFIIETEARFYVRQSRGAA